MRKFSLLVSVIALIAVLMLGVTAPANAQSGRTYVVQPGDTLFSIAARFNVGASDLATLNHIYDVNAIYVGEVLVIPDSQPVYQPQPSYNPQPNYGYQPQPNYNPQPNYGYQPVYTPPRANCCQTTTTVKYVSYYVQPGDTLSSIAWHYGVSVQSIMSANGIWDPNFIWVGECLQIPISTTTTYRQPVTYQHPAYNSNPYWGKNVYIVQPGDNLFSIAARYHKDPFAIARANNIYDLNLIYVGMPLIIP